jgi:hypothetical protein
MTFTIQYDDDNNNHNLLLLLLLLLLQSPDEIKKSVNTEIFIKQN